MYCSSQMGKYQGSVRANCSVRRVEQDKGQTQPVFPLFQSFWQRQISTKTSRKHECVHVFTGARYRLMTVVMFKLFKSVFMTAALTWDLMTRLWLVMKKLDVLHLLRDFIGGWIVIPELGGRSGEQTVRFAPPRLTWMKTTILSNTYGMTLLENSPYFPFPSRDNW